MSDPDASTPPAGHPSVTRRRRHRVSLVWLVPALAALIGLAMLAHAWWSRGPQVTVMFRTASGLEAGKTPVKYKDVAIGTVASIALSSDGSRVIATLSLQKSGLNLAAKDTRFWVVRPRIGAGGISGIDTLLSGAYIGVDVGTSEETSSEFTGLETPPTVIGGTPGKSFRLRTDDLGSLDIGSPVFYRRIPVGRVASYQLEPNGRSVDLTIFIDAPNDRFVTTDTRFWNASGVDLSIGADGLKLKSQSIATIVAGGISFAPAPRDRSPAAPQNAEFTLARDQDTAMAPVDGPAQYLQLRFDQPLRGLSVGAPVQFAGVDFGRVVSTQLDYDTDTQRFPTVVGLVVYPQRLGNVIAKVPRAEGDPDQQTRRLLAGMVARGLRAQARAGNLLTGQLYISLDFLPTAPKVAYNADTHPLTLPTVPGSFDRLQEQLTHIVTTIEKLPLDSIGRHLDASLSSLDKTLRQVDAQVLPETTRTLKQAQQTIGAAQQAIGTAQQTIGAAQGLLADDAPLQQNLGQTLLETQRAARSLRTLTDLLNRSPEALLRGRSTDPAVPAAAPQGSKP